MTNNQTSQPFEPFRVQSPLLQNAAPSSAAGGQGSGGAGGATPFGRFDWNQARWLVMILFAVIYWAAESDPLLRPLTLLVLLACLLLKLDRRFRNIAGVPLALASLRLIQQMAARAGALPGAQFPLADNVKNSLAGLPWVPMFLAVCIFYMPPKASVTAMILRAEAVGLLLSGLIPGDGYVAVLAMIQYTLFIGVLVGLIVDVSPNGASQSCHQTAPAAQA
jgi:hypothetical protein